MYLCLTTLALLWFLPGTGQAEPAGRVVLVSIDALRPEFYLREGDGAFPSDTLKRLAREGAHVKAVEDVFPSVTYPNHATMITGVRPAKHGVVFNEVWDPTFQRKGWYRLATDLKARTLWEAVHDAGGVTAGINWPVTVGAAIDWNVPEGGASGPDPIEGLRQAATPGLLAEIEKAAGPLTKDRTKTQAEWDAFAAKGAGVILRAHPPHLLVLHIVQADGAQHENGREHEAVRAAVGRADGLVADILAAARDAGIEKETTVIVTGDHGFIDYTRIVSPNFALRESGFLAGTKDAPEWRAAVHVSGAGAGVYVKEGTDAAAVEKALRAKAEEDGKRLFGIVGRAELDALGAMPGAAFGLEAEPGVTFSGDLEPKAFLRAVGKTKGMHGYLPSRPEMHTGLILWGRGVKPGAVLESARLVDVAPTAAKLLGAELPGAEGRVLTELIQQTEERRN